MWLWVKGQQNESWLVRNCLCPECWFSGAASVLEYGVRCWAWAIFVKQNIVSLQKRMVEVGWGEGSWSIKVRTLRISFIFTLRRNPKTFLDTGEALLLFVNHCCHGAFTLCVFRVLSSQELCLATGWKSQVRVLSWSYGGENGVSPRREKVWSCLRRPYWRERLCVDFEYVVNYHI